MVLKYMYIDRLVHGNGNPMGFNGMMINIPWKEMRWDGTAHICISHGTVAMS